MDKKTFKMVWDTWDAADTLGLAFSTIKWFFIWTFRGILVIISCGLVLFMFFTIAMSKAKREQEDG